MSTSESKFVLTVERGHVTALLVKLFDWGFYMYREMAMKSETKSNNHSTSSTISILLPCHPTVCPQCRSAATKDTHQGRLGGLAL